MEQMTDKEYEKLLAKFLKHNGEFQTNNKMTLGQILTLMCNSVESVIHYHIEKEPDCNCCVPLIDLMIEQLTNLKKLRSELNGKRKNSRGNRKRNKVGKASDIQTHGRFLSECA